MFSYGQILDKILNRENLKSDEASWLMNATMEGALTPVQTAGWLAGIRAKGETSEEIGSFAAIMREKAVRLKSKHKILVDTCGTGGDKSELMNISTLSAITLASMGIPVAKHGNRAVSSKCGSADILEKLGYRLDETTEKTAKRLDEDNFAFLFAPLYHPAMKHAAVPRKELGVRTIFNILGPLSNPAYASVHLLGVFSKNMMKTMAEALLKLNTKAALVVSSEDGLDEISPAAPTSYVFVHDDKIQEGVLNVEEFNLSNKDIKNLKVNDEEEALLKAKDTLGGVFLPGVEAVCLNATAALFLWEKANKNTSLSLDEFMKQKYSIVFEEIKLARPLKYIEKWQK